jgi:hypothetical protein
LFYVLVGQAMTEHNLGAIFFRQSRVKAGKC